MEIRRTRLISDIHGQYEIYLDIIQNCEYSVQLGDYGFSYESLDKVDSNKHKMLQGNHDGYSEPKTQHNLGDYGFRRLPNDFEFFFVRGAFSIDRVPRILSTLSGAEQNIWSQEELPYELLRSAILDYKYCKSDIVLTHDCPLEISQQIGKPSMLRQFGFDPAKFLTATQYALQLMWESHQPRLWVFGHYHTPWVRKIGNTTFVCVDEYDYIDVVNDEIWTSGGNFLCEF